MDSVYLSEIPAAPSWLRPAAVEKWHEVGPLLLGVLTRLDLEAFAIYCQCYAHYRDAQAWMAEHGTTMTLRNDKGEVKMIAPVPHVGVAQKMLAEMHKYEVAFGLTPAARSARLESLTEEMTDDDLIRIAEADAGAGESGTGKTGSETRAG